MRLHHLLLAGLLLLAGCAGIGPRGIFGFAADRASISVHPPQPGISPTPTSTNPM